MLKINNLMLLNEISQISTFDNKDAISEWMSRYCPKARFTINDDLTVDVMGSINLTSCRTNLGLLQQLPFKFNFVGGDFRCMDNRIKSFKNFPQKIGRSLYVRDNEIESIEGIPSEVSENIYMSDNKIKSFHDIHKHVKYVTRISCDGDITHLLGLIKIPTLETVDFGANLKVQSIINYHLQGDRRPLICQNDLIAAGFIDQAKF